MSETSSKDREPIHSHPGMERLLKVGPDHVIVDRALFMRSLARERDLAEARDRIKEAEAYVADLERELEEAREEIAEGDFSLNLAEAELAEATCKCEGLSGEDAETLFCMALLRVLDTRQMASVLKVYNEELKPNAPRMLAGVRAATQEGER